MHSTAPYLFRCYNKALGGRNEERYSTLDNLGDKDLFYLLKAFLEAHTQSLTIIEDTKQVFQFETITVDEEYREIRAWFNVGHYGMKTDIINVDTGKIDFLKAQNNAEIIKHYIHFFIPKGFNEGMAFMHSYRGVGIKTLFHSQFSAYFKDATDLVIQMNPLTYDKAVDAWLNASAKELKVTKFSGLDDIADQVKQLGHNEQELVIHAKRSGSLGKLRDFFNKDSEQMKTVEILGEYGEQVKTVVEIEGKRRTFTVGRNASSSLCEIEMEDNLINEDGIPNFDKVKSWVRSIIGEYSKSMYPGLTIKVK
jgi:hypothetical protein